MSVRQQQGGCPTAELGEAGGGETSRAESPLMAGPDPPSRRRGRGGSGGEKERPKTGAGGGAGAAASGSGAGAGPPPRRSPPRPGLGRQDGGEEGREDDPRAEAAELAGRLDRASEDLVDNLFRFLSACRRGRGGGGGMRKTRRRTTAAAVGGRRRNGGRDGGRGTASPFPPQRWDGSRP